MNFFRLKDILVYIKYKKFKLKLELKTAKKLAKFFSCGTFLLPNFRFCILKKKLQNSLEFIKKKKNLTLRVEK